MDLLKVNFITDEPTSEDVFEGHAHQKIAEVLLDHIENSDSKSRLIGLEGAWGSGKSSVIMMLESLSENNGYFVLTYDAWSHQEDNPRRAFLEEITSRIKDKFSDTESKGIWENRLKDLLAKKKITHNIKTPHLSYGIIIGTIAAITTPIFQRIGSIDWFHPAASVVITSIPLLVCSVLVGRLWHIEKKKLLKNEDTPPDFLQWLIALRENKEMDVTNNETVFEDEPSVMKFRNYLMHINQVCEEESPPFKRIVIVFDNMDRLPKEKVRDLWSLIYTFFADKSIPNISVVIPYDKNHLGCCFTDNEGVPRLKKVIRRKNNSSTEESNMDDLNSSNSCKPIVSSFVFDEFIMKTFSVTFRVPPPVMSDWISYFEKRYIEAFASSEELSQVRQLFQLKHIETSPRLIISFINDMVSIYKTSNEHIPLRGSVSKVGVNWSQPDEEKG